MVKSCYIINFYLGERRKVTTQYHSDKLFLLKKQIETLYQYKHSLSKIVFNFNMREEDYKYVSEIFKITPKIIQECEVEINFRKNEGMSYGAWSNIFDKYKNKYDYYIFNEDDYFFIQNEWDNYLINKYNSYNDCGYLCMMVREADSWNQYRKHAGHSTGISSNENLLKIVEKYGRLPYNENNDYKSNEDNQRTFSFSFIGVGLNIYDVRDRYRVPFAGTNDDYDIIRFYWWNKEDIILPAILLGNNTPHTWYQPLDPEFREGYQNSTYEEAIYCCNNKTKIIIK